MTLTTTPRIHSIDILRGLVMIIMALDHTRDFFALGGLTQNPLDLATTTPALFLTRWITHFCAPIFVFLSGISAALSLQRNKDENGKFLIKRGLWLILAEVTIICFGITFNPLFNVVILQVIWAIGFSLLLLGLLRNLPKQAILIIGIIIVVGHDALRYLPLPTEGAGGIFWTVFFTSPGAFIPMGEKYFLAMFYSAIPWSGIMFVGFGLSELFAKDYPAPNRRRHLMKTGILVLVFFTLLRFTNIYGDPSLWTAQKNGLLTFFSFVNISKYPPSLLYSCLTVGTGLLFLSLTETSSNWLAKIMTDYGRVPFFYYILHFYLIHAILLILFYASGYGSADIVAQGSPFLFRPLAFGYTLPVVYGLWLLIVAILYRPCVWYWGYKSSHREKWWTRYI